jgi:GAG-pre-integrase domain
VLHVPSITKNLLSVSQLLKDNSVNIEFLSDYCLIKDVKSNKTLLYGRLHNGLYQLNSLSSHQTHALHTSITSPDIWHFRLGHCSTSIIDGLRKDQLISVNSLKFSVCLDCNKAKAHKLPFVNSTSCANRPLEVIHSDLWGPAPIVSQKGNRYYVLFIDEVSRFTWLYPCSCKSDVPKIFAFFKNKVETLFASSIDCFQCDGGGEYKPVMHQFPNITFRVSCPYTSEQNVSTDMLLSWLWQPFPIPQSL